MLSRAYQTMCVVKTVMPEEHGCPSPLETSETELSQQQTWLCLWLDCNCAQFFLLRNRNYATYFGFFFYRNSQLDFKLKKNKVVSLSCQNFKNWIVFYSIILTQDFRIKKERKGYGLILMYLFVKLTGSQLLWLGFIFLFFFVILTQLGLFEKRKSQQRKSFQHIYPQARLWSIFLNND